MMRRGPANRRYAAVAPMTVLIVLAMILLALVLGGCGDISCGAYLGETTETVSTTASSSTTTTLPPTTTTSSTTTTSTTSTTSTTLSPLETYRAAMRVWADTYGPGLSQAYTAMSGANFTNPTPAQVQAAKDLDTLMGTMVPDLKAINPPPELAQAHADFAASLEKMAGGVHDLSEALQQGQGFLAIAAVAKVATAWQEGASARTTLEQALGFSLSG